MLRVSGYGSRGGGGGRGGGVHACMCACVCVRACVFLSPVGYLTSVKASSVLDELTKWTVWLF